MLDHLYNILLDIEKESSEPRDSEGLKVVIMKANGPVFSSGHDLRELVAASHSERRVIFSRLSKIALLMRNINIPIIAQVDQLASAAGYQLATSCDFIICSENAQFSCPGVKIGFACTTPGVAIGRTLPVRKALELCVTGDPLSSKEALLYGLVNRVVQSDKLDEETLQFAQTIVKHSSQTIKIAKRSFYQQMSMDIAQAYDYAEDVMVKSLNTEDAKEGISSFLEKKSPKWKY